MITRPGTRWVVSQVRHEWRSGCGVKLDPSGRGLAHVQSGFRCQGRLHFRQRAGSTPSRRFQMLLEDAFDAGQLAEVIAKSSSCSGRYRVSGNTRSRPPLCALTRVDAATPRGSGFIRG